MKIIASLLVLTMLASLHTMPVFALSQAQYNLYQADVRHFEVEAITIEDPGAGGGGAGSGPLGCEADPDGQKIWDYFTKTRSMAPGVAAGFLGNMEEEANFNPRQMEIAYSDPPHLSDDVPPSINAKGQPGFGIIQWTSQGRKDGLAALAQDRNIKACDLGLQLDYVWQELNGNYKGSTLDPLVALGPNANPREASEIITRNYEIPSNMSAAVARRQNRASHYFNLYSGTQ